MELCGWIRNHRKQKKVGFIDFNDGTFFDGAQIFYDETVADFADVQNYKVGAAIKVKGYIRESVGKNQKYEIVATAIELEGDSLENYPIQPKRHSREFLREVAYLRPRTNLFQAVFKIRSSAALAIHRYMADNGFVYVNAPILTDSDCEGAGEMFQVTTLDLEHLPKDEDGRVDYSRDFFGKKVGLTVSAQFEGEAFAMALKKIYTFGPTFRAENSNTKYHASEFWQVEPEIAFCDLEGLMQIEEDMLRYIISQVLEECQQEMSFLDSFVEKGLINRLDKVLNSKSVKITHAKAIELLQQAGRDWEFPPVQGGDIAKEHEKYLTEELFNAPVFITDWPKDIKCFYMKLNDDGKTVAAVDYLVPGAGELMGGSQREEHYEKLLQAMQDRQMNIDEISWYVNLRKYGTCRHAGFGMGFERLMIYLTGVDNIRDVIAFPRTPGNCMY